ncbi:MAG: thioesterase family protein [Acidimicrobiales bacterium]
MTTSAAKPRRDPGADSAFDRETAIESTGPGLWRARLDRHWNINDSPNGGYAASPLVRAMAAEVDGHPDPISFTVHFLRPAVGDAEAAIATDVIRRGRRTSSIRASSVQHGKPRLEAIATFGDLSDAADGAADDGYGLEIEPPSMPPPEECVDRLELVQGVELPLLSRVEVRIDPRFATPGAAGEAATAGWIRFRDGREPDSTSLVLFADSFPPSLFGLVGRRTGRVPTIELTVHVRRRPVPGWLRGRFRTREVAGATLVEDGVIWDGTDRVVAHARQLAMVAG